MTPPLIAALYLAAGLATLAWLRAGAGSDTTRAGIGVVGSLLVVVGWPAVVAAWVGMGVVAWWWWNDID